MGLLLPARRPQRLTKEATEDRSPGLRSPLFPRHPCCSRPARAGAKAVCCRCGPACRHLRRELGARRARRGSRHGATCAVTRSCCMPIAGMSPRNRRSRWPRHRLREDVTRWPACPPAPTPVPALRLRRRRLSSPHVEWACPQVLDPHVRVPDERARLRAPCGLLVAMGSRRPRARGCRCRVLNTCCIRENADNKLYGTWATSSRSKGAPGRRSPWAAAWRKDARLVSGRVRRRVFAPTTSGGPALLRHRRARADHRDLGRPDPTAPRARPASRVRSCPTPLVTIQTGCDNSCAFCIVPAVRGPEASRPWMSFSRRSAARRRRRRRGPLLGQNVNSYGRT